MQTEVTSYVATHSHSNSSCEILREHRELLQQVSAGCLAAARGQEGASRWHVAVLLSQVVADAEVTCCRQEGTAEEHGHEADCVVAAELRARQQQVGSSTAEQAQSRRAELAGGCPQPQPERGSACACSLEGGQPGAALLSPCPCRRELAAQLQAELSQWQWKQQVTLEQAVQHMHAAAHAAEKLQRSQEQLQVLKEQVGRMQDLLQGPLLQPAHCLPAPWTAQGTDLAWAGSSTSPALQHPPKHCPRCSWGHRRSRARACGTAWPSCRKSWEPPRPRSSKVCSSLAEPRRPSKTCSRKWPPRESTWQSWCSR